MIEKILNKVYTSELLSSEELHILTEWICDKDKEIERLNNIIFNQNKRNSHQRIANDNLQNKNKELNNIIKDINKILKDDDFSHIEKLQEIHKLVGSDKE